MNSTPDLYRLLAEYSTASGQARAKEIIRDVDARTLANAFADSEPVHIQLGFLEAYKESRAEHALAEAAEQIAREAFNAAKKHCDQTKK